MHALLALGLVLSLTAAAPAPPALRPVTVDAQDGYVDARGKVVVVPRFSRAHGFSDGLGRVELEGRTRWIAPDGDFAFEASFEHGRDFHEGLAAVRLDRDHYGFIDATGKVLFSGRWDRVGDFSDGRSWVELPIRRLGYIDRTGRVVFEVPGGDAGDPSRFSEGLVGVEVRGEGVVYFDPDGNRVIHRPDARFGRGFSEGLAPVRLADGWIFIDRTGAQALPKTYGFAWGFREGLALVEDEGRQVFIDREGKVAVRPPKAVTEVHASFSEGLAAVKVGDKLGWMDRKGRLAIPARWDDPEDSASSFRGGLARVGKRVRLEHVGEVLTLGWIDAKGRVVWKPSR